MPDTLLSKELASSVAAMTSESRFGVPIKELTSENSFSLSPRLLATFFDT
jgi:hypothetical protein